MWRKMKDTEQKELSVPTRLRIRNDITTAVKELLPGIHVHPDEEDITRFHAIIEGPENTPYSGGYFYFLVEFPNDYPMSPPKVCYITINNPV